MGGVGAFAGAECPQPDGFFTRLADCVSRDPAALSPALKSFISKANVNNS